jgi:hypothetical protein
MPWHAGRDAEVGEDARQPVTIWGTFWMARPSAF